ncbi:MAG TPA: hypothetical protein VFF73_35735 [Planctomycetota bacterium]|nr:hypothetical protein [Planctomycetota bacterium]
MRHVLLGVVVLLGAGRAHGAILGGDRIELRPPTVEVARLEPEGVWRNSSPSSVRAFPFEDERSVLDFHLPEVGPEGLDLRIDWERLHFSVGAEMNDGDGSFSPRLECDSRQTYFWVRFSVDLDERLAVFCETFQAAGSILGWNKQWDYQRYVWDGYQIQGGLHLKVRERVSIEGGPVLFAFSATRKPDTLGGRVGLGVEF